MEWACPVGPWSGRVLWVHGVGVSRGPMEWACPVGPWSGRVPWVHGVGVSRGPMEWACPVVPALSACVVLQEFWPVCVLSTLQSTLTLWSLRGLSLPMYVVFKRCLPFATLSIGVCVLRNGVPRGNALTHAPPGAGDLTGDPFGYVTGVLAVVVHASYLVLIQKTSLDSAHGPLTAQYAIAVMATPVLLVCSLVSMDAVSMWSYAGWREPGVSALFSVCVLLGCCMNFTTLHCTYINSAVTTSFVGVVKSIATITVGVLAFSDVAPTRLFLGGVAVNTVGSVTYCAVKYYETRRKSLYEDLEEEGGGAGGGGGGEPASGGPGPAADGEAWTGDGEAWTGDGAAGGGVMTEEEALEMQREHLHGGRRPAPPARPAPPRPLSDVWRSIRNLQPPKGETLVDHMEQQSP
ncbi:Solute carrier family 35 member D3 [Liparis tanakae]|uniref:Solute carrier family 35 member D3 n=1 Tax=Liparis tanakae TaxID=230148 RepID=A0A4Z2ELY0_9TELE|nr:Solute carrier family 35 member D3 [Liparis tanakae]